MSAFRRRMIMLIAVSLVLAVPLGLWRFFAKSSDLTDDVRGLIIELLVGQRKLGEADRLDWAPAIGVSKYGLGSVFLPGENLFRYSENCDQVKSINSDDERALAIDRSFHLAPSGSFTPKLTEAKTRNEAVEAKISAASRINYSIETTSTELISSKRTLLKNLVEDADCLADIAGRQVHVLAARIIGKETYEIEQSLSSKISAKLGSLFGAEGESGQSQTSKVSDAQPRVLLWAFTEMELTDDRIPTAAPPAFRKSAARDLVNTETEYWKVAEQNTQYRKPTDTIYRWFEQTALERPPGGE